MKKLCFTSLVLLAFAIAGGNVFADATTQQVVTNFNNMNSGRGYLFEATTTTQFFGQRSGENRMKNMGTDTPDLSGYTGATSNNGTGENFYFQTFCVAPEQSFYPNEVTRGKLNYNQSAGTTSTTQGNKLNLGIAYLYMKFAEGSLSDYNYSYGSSRVSSAVLLQDAIWFLLGETSSLVNASTSWTNNTFLQQLADLNGSQAYWMQNYDPANNYGGIMGDAKVFVVQTQFESMARSPALVRQDVLYVTRAGGSNPGVPEPATVLLWTMGSLGAAGMAYRKRHIAK